MSSSCSSNSGGVFTIMFVSISDQYYDWRCGSTSGAKKTGLTAAELHLAAATVRVIDRVSDGIVVMVRGWG